MSAEDEGHKTKQSLDAEELENFKEILRDCSDNYTHKVTDWELSFSEDVLKLLEKYGEYTMLSAKQIAIIKRIADKIYI